MSKYSIWVLDYAAVNKFPQSVMLYGPQYVGIRNLPYAYVLIKGQGHVILVDTGYDHKEYGKYLADLYGVSTWHPASEVLADATLGQPTSRRSSSRTLISITWVGSTSFPTPSSISRSAKSISGCGR